MNQHQDNNEAHRQVEEVKRKMIDSQAEIANQLGPLIYKLLFEQIETGRSLAIVAGSLATVSIFASEKLSSTAGFPFYICAIMGFLLTAALAMIHVHFSVYNALIAHNKKWDEAMEPLDKRFNIAQQLLDGVITPEQADIEDGEIVAQMKEKIRPKTESKLKEPFFSHVIIGIFVVSIILMMFSFLSVLFSRNDKQSNDLIESCAVVIPHKKHAMDFSMPYPPNHKCIRHNRENSKDLFFRHYIKNF